MSKKKANGEGTIYFNGKYWVGQVATGYDPDTGKLKRRTLYGKVKREVREQMTEIKYQIDKNAYIEPSTMTLGEWAVFWLENFKKHHVSPVSYANYECHIKNHIITPLGGIPLKSLNTLQIQSYLNKMRSEQNLSSEFIGFVHKKLNSMLEQAVTLDMLAKNPCRGVVIPKQEMKRPAIALSVEDQKKLVDYCYLAKSNYLFIFLLGTGLRIGEALGLTWQQVNFDKSQMSITQISSELHGTPYLKSCPKTQSSYRTIPLSDKIKKLLLEIQEFQDTEKNTLNLVFPSERHTIISSSNMRRRFEKVCLAAGIAPTHPHTLRHTFATRMLEQNVNIKVLSDILGHKNIQITLNRYAHVLPDLKKENMVKIDEFL